MTKKSSLLAIALAMGFLGHAVGQILTIKVDRKVSLVQYARTGKYDFVLPVFEDLPPQTMSHQETDLEISLIPLPGKKDVDEVFDELAKMGLRPLDLQEFLALGAQRPYVLRTVQPVICAGSYLPLPTQGADTLTGFAYIGRVSDLPKPPIPSLTAVAGLRSPADTRFRLGVLTTWDRCFNCLFAATKLKP